MPNKESTLETFQNYRVQGPGDHGAAYIRESSPYNAVLQMMMRLDPFEEDAEFVTTDERDVSMRVKVTPKGALISAKRLP